MRTPCTFALLLAAAVISCPPAWRPRLSLPMKEVSYAHPLNPHCQRCR